MVVEYSVLRPRVLGSTLSRSAGNGVMSASPDYWYDYRLYGADAAEADYWVKGGSRRPYLQVSLTLAQGGRLVVQLRKLFVFNSSVCNPGPRPVGCQTAAHVHHGGRLVGGRNCREANMSAETHAGHERRRRA